MNPRVALQRILGFQKTLAFRQIDVIHRTMAGYTTGTENRLLSDGTFDYTYDNEGNTLTKMRISDGQVTTNTYDYRNRLMRVVVKNAEDNILKEARYTYDVYDRRIGVWEDADGAGSGLATERWTVYDGDNPYADFDGSGDLTNQYLYGLVIDQIFARADAIGNIDWYLTDILGSVRQLVAADGTVINEIAYDSFGQILSETDAAAGDRFKYTEREWDALTAQYYYRARYFGPDTGRFTQEDPIRFAAGDSNLYRYVGNSPTNATDPTGKWLMVIGVIGLIATEWGAIYGGNHGPPGEWERFIPFWGPGRAAGDHLRNRQWEHVGMNLAEIGMDFALVGPLVNGCRGFLLWRAGGAATAATTVIRINITQEGIAHVANRHTAGGAQSAGENVLTLVRQAERLAPVRQAGGNFERIVNVGRNIGIDRATGQPTSIYTVITNAAGELVTAFPGRPIKRNGL